MSKTIIRKRSKQKEIDPKFGVSEWDPAELDVRQTRHGTYCCILGHKPLYNYTQSETNEDVRMYT